MNEEMETTALLKKELTEDQLEKVAGGVTAFTDMEGRHHCGALSDSAAFELCYIGRRGCMEYYNNGEDVRTAPNRCSACVYYFTT